MSIRYGGESNEEYGFRMTVEAPDGTSGPVGDIQPLGTQLVLPGQIYKLGGVDADGGGYKLVPVADEDTIAGAVLVQAMTRSSIVGPMTVIVLSKFSQVRRLPYKTGAAPTIGQSIVMSDTIGTVDGLSFDGGSYVLFVDTDNLEVEVLC